MVWQKLQVNWNKNWELSKGVALQFIKEKCKVSAHVKMRHVRVTTDVMTGTTPTIVETLDVMEAAGITVPEPHMAEATLEMERRRA